MSNQSVFDQLEASAEESEPMSERERVLFLLRQWIVIPFKTIWEDWRSRLGLALITLYLLMGTVGVWLVDSPVQNEGSPLLNPMENPQFPLGTDNWGIDLLEQAVHATPAMLKMALAGGLFMTMVAVLVGSVSGFKRGMTERVLMTLTDIQISIPGLPLLVVIALAVQPEDPIVVGVILSIDGWPNLARALHSQVISLREESYVEASRTLGIGNMQIIRDDILPNIMPYVLINFMQNTIRVIHTSVGLYFLGVLPFTTTNWGVMLNRAFYNISLLTLSGWHWLLLPIILISGLSFGVILLAQGMDRLFNPRVRARLAKSEDDDQQDAPVTP